MKWWLFLLLGCYLVSMPANAKQVVFTISKVPDYTPAEDTLFFCSNVNEWLLADTRYVFQRLDDGRYRLALDVPEGLDLEFKINRGDWDKVEGTGTGGLRANRYIAWQELGFDVDLVIDSWQDLHGRHFPGVTFRITELPGNTPVGSPLYLSGTFNDWNASDPQFELKKQEDGTYTCSVPPGNPYFEYKFSRGSWSTSESRWDGGLRANRVYRSGMEPVVNIRIFGWADLSRGIFWAQVGFLAMAIQLGLMLLLFVYKHHKLYVLAYLLMIVNVLILFGVNDNQMAPYLTKLRFWPGFSLPLFMWLFYRRQTMTHAVKSWLLLAVLLIPPVVFYAITYSEDAYTMYLRIANNQQTHYFIYIYGWSVGWTMILIYLLHQLKSRMTELKQEQVKLLLYGFAVVVTVAVFMTILMFFDVQTIALVNWFENISWGLLSSGLLLYEYRVIKNVLAKQRVRRDDPEEILDEKFTDLARQVDALLKKDHLFTSHQLTVNEIARQIGTNNLYLSKAVNQAQRMNFNEYINKLRVEYFINKYQTEKGEHTILSLSYDCGFNSKSAFNRAFKKHTGKTPTEFFE